MGPYKLRVYESYSEEVFKLIKDIDSEVFENHYPIEKMRAKALNKEAPLILFFFLENHPVAFKAGFQKEDYFYSWMGGVLKMHRGQGLALELMKKQHQWAKEKHFSRVRTHTDDRFLNMLKLNLKSGFKVIEKQQRAHQAEKLILEKKLL